MAAIWGGSSVHVIALLMCQRPVLTLRGWNCPAAAKTTEAAEQITTTESLFRISFSMRVVDRTNGPSTACQLCGPLLMTNGSFPSPLDLPSLGGRFLISLLTDLALMMLLFGAARQSGVVDPASRRGLCYEGRILRRLFR